MKVKKGLEVIEEKKEPRTPSTANKLKLFKALNPPLTTSKLNFTVCTSMCRSELELIQHVISMNGFNETTLPSQASLIWFGLALQPKDLELLLRRKTMPHFNRYPGLEYLARKKIFCAIVNRMRKTFPKTIKFCPRSF